MELLDRFNHKVNKPEFKSSTTQVFFITDISDLMLRYIKACNKYSFEIVIR